MPNLLTVDNEVLTMFCGCCKCCLASSTHCGTCHVKKSIKQLCGCGGCEAKALDYLEREESRRERLESLRKIK